MKLTEFTEKCENCRKAQQETLHSIIKFAAESDYGKQHGFSHIKTYKDFRKNLPVNEWKDLAPYAEKAENGIPDQLFPEMPQLFIITSGTTGKEKILPESRRGLEAKKEVTLLRIEAIKKFAPDLFDAKILPLTNKAVYGHTPSGIPYGSASGVTLMTAPDALKKLTAYPFPALEIEDPEAMDYVIMRFAVTEDIRFIAANNAGRIAAMTRLAADNPEILLRDIADGTVSEKFALSAEKYKLLEPFLTPAPEKARKLEQSLNEHGKLSPGISYWHHLRTVNCWLSSSIGRYVEPLKAEMPESVLFFDIGYGATEGKFTIPLEPDLSAALLAISSYFFEFIPQGMPETETVTADCLEDGGIYEIIITSFSGLYRYRMKDLVKVEGFLGTTPRIVFQSKTGEIADICGEKLAASVIIDAVNKASGQTGIIPEHWCVVPDTGKSAYIFHIELKNNEPIPAENTPEILAQAIEKELFGNGILPYPVFRRQHLLNPAEVVIMRSGWRDTLVDTTKKSGGINQLKLPVIYQTVPLPHFIKPV